MFTIINIICNIFGFDSIRMNQLWWRNLYLHFRHNECSWITWVWYPSERRCAFGALRLPVQFVYKLIASWSIIIQICLIPQSWTASSHANYANPVLIHKNKDPITFWTISNVNNANLVEKSLSKYVISYSSCMTVPTTAVDQRFPHPIQAMAPTWLLRRIELARCQHKLSIWWVVSSKLWLHQWKAKMLSDIRKQTLLLGENRDVCVRGRSDTIRVMMICQ